MKTWSSAALILTLPILCGCSTSTHVVFGPKRPPVPVAAVRLYYEPPARYEVVALLDASGSSLRSRQREVDQVVTRLKREAAALGANGVLLRGIGEHYRGSASVGFANATPIGNSVFASGSGLSMPITDTKGSGMAIFVEDGADPLSAAVAVAAPQAGPPESVGVIDPKLFQTAVGAVEVPAGLTDQQVKNCLVSIAGAREWQVVASDDHHLVIVHGGRGWDAKVGMLYTDREVQFYSDSTRDGEPSVPTSWLKNLRHDAEKDLRALKTQ